MCRMKVIDGKSCSFSQFFIYAQVRKRTIDVYVLHLKNNYEEDFSCLRSPVYVIYLLIIKSSRYYEES